MRTRQVFTMSVPTIAPAGRVSKAGGQRAVRVLAEFGYALLGFPWAVLGVLSVVLPMALGVGLAVTLVGLPLLAGAIVWARASGSVDRALLRLVGTHVPPPVPVVRPRGFFAWSWSGLRDGAGWRAVGYRLVKVPLAAVTMGLALGFWGYGLVGLSYPVWRLYLPTQADSHGFPHRGASFGANYFVDTPPRVTAVAVAGVILLVLAPWMVRGPVLLDGLLIRNLLGRSRHEDRIRELERSRTTVVDDSATMLRRIERDLHDGTQPQLVAVAMRLGLAREELDQDRLDVNRLRALLETAHRGATDAIGDLRVLAQGIHPPILDSGLEAALTTVAARSAVPVRLDIDLPVRPSAAMETVLSFCATELLNNAAKHSKASHIALELTGTEATSTLAVRDDGVGGASLGTTIHSGQGTGLVGLADRIRAFDGTLRVDSPTGGPTVVTIELANNV
jgi:signal transduction histidine kinase